MPILDIQDESTGPVERPNVKESEEELNAEEDLHGAACSLLQRQALNGINHSKNNHPNNVHKNGIELKVGIPQITVECH
jgi:hypothetical protein